MRISFFDKTEKEFEHPVYEIKITNMGLTPVRFNGNAPANKDSLLINSNETKTLGYSGITRMYFDAVKKNVRGDIDISKIVYLQPITRGEVGTDELVIDLFGTIKELNIRNIYGNDLYICPNASVNLDNNTAYRIQAGEYLFLEQNIDKLYIKSIGSCRYELYVN